MLRVSMGSRRRCLQRIVSVLILIISVRKGGCPSKLPDALFQEVLRVLGGKIPNRRQTESFTFSLRFLTSRISWAVSGVLSEMWMKTSLTSLGVPRISTTKRSRVRKRCWSSGDRSSNFLPCREGGGSGLGTAVPGASFLGSGRGNLFWMYSVIATRRCCPSTSSTAISTWSLAGIPG